MEEDFEEEEKAKLRKAAKKAAKKAKRERNNIDALTSDNVVVNQVDNCADLTEVIPEVQSESMKDQTKKKKVKKDKQDKTKQETTGDHTLLHTRTVTTKSMYVEHSITKALTDKEIKSHRDELGIQVFPEESSDIFKPLTSFECLTSSLKSYCPYIMNYIRAKQFSKPSPIQSQCWAPLLSGRDVVGIAATGSGKTLGFLIPGLLRLEYLKSANKCYATASSNKKSSVPTPKILIVAPTRELAMQSYQVVEDLGGPKGVCIYGGVPKGMQKQSLQGGAEIVVATPGRLMDLIEEHELSLTQVCYLVLDEADRMLDEGFEPVIRKIISLCPQVSTSSDTFEQSLSKRQTVMFSATWPEEIRNLADKFLNHDMIKVTVGSDELSANHRVKQIVECVQAYEKDKKLTQLLESYHKSRKNRILIFVLYKKEAADLQAKLTGKGYNVTAIHGVSALYTILYYTTSTRVDVCLVATFVYGNVCI